MKNRRVLACSLAAAALMAAVPVGAQIFGASGWVTVTMAGLGNTTTVAAESRIPVLARDLDFVPATGHLHLRATGHRGAVRLLEITVQSAHAGSRIELADGSAAQLHVQLEDGAELTAETGHGFVAITAMDEHHVAGSYEGTFHHGAVPVVLRGRFDANVGRPANASPPAAQ